MHIVHDDEDLREFVAEAVRVSPEHPVLIDKFLEDAIEIDVDAVADVSGRRAGSWSIEKAGFTGRRGLRAAALPPSAKDRSGELRAQTRAPALRPAWSGSSTSSSRPGRRSPCSRQPAFRTVLCLRRSLPSPIATRPCFTPRCAHLTGARAPIAGRSRSSFIKLPGADAVLGPEMKSQRRMESTGIFEGPPEVAGAAGDTAYRGAVFISVKTRQRLVTTLAAPARWAFPSSPRLAPRACSSATA
jgi:carbamoyl-phosphate synthase large subunit